MGGVAKDLLAALSSAPVIRLGETLDEFRVRYGRWHREVKVPAERRAWAEGVRPGAADVDLLAAAEAFLGLQPLSGYELEAYCSATLVPALEAAVARAKGVTS